MLAIKAGIKTAKLSTQPSPNKSHRRNLSTHSVDSVVSIGKEQDSSRVNTPTPSPLSSTTPEPSSAPRSEPRGEPRGEPDSQDGAGKQQDDDVNEHDGTDSRAEAEAAATVANPSTSDAAPDIDTTNAGSDGDGSAVPGDDGSAIADDLDVDALEFCFRAKALYEFVAADEEELSFPAGVVIEVCVIYIQGSNAIDLL